jgi:hypothetical protein
LGLGRGVKFPLRGFSRRGAQNGSAPAGGRTQ